MTDLYETHIRIVGEEVGERGESATIIFSFISPYSKPFAECGDNLSVWNEKVFGNKSFMCHVVTDIPDTFYEVFIYDDQTITIIGNATTHVLDSNLFYIDGCTTYRLGDHGEPTEEL